MQADDNKALVRRRFELFDRGNLGVFDELFASDYVFHVPGTEKPLSRAEMQQFYKALYYAIPDLRHTLVEQIAEGDKVVTRWTATGTHRGGPFFGVASTGRLITLRGINIYRIAGGQLAESHVSWDMLGLLQQLGSVPGSVVASLRAIGTWPTPERPSRPAAGAPARKAAKTRKRKAAVRKVVRRGKRKAAIKTKATRRRRRSR
jgi:steroid delta-isomerase-like uncharacterized protein